MESIYVSKRSLRRFVYEQKLECQGQVEYYNNGKPSEFMRGKLAMLKALEDYLESLSSQED